MKRFPFMRTRRGINEENVMKKRIDSGKAPKAMGPYSQAIRAGNLIFASGQVAVEPASGKMVPGGIGEQTRQVMENLRAVLQAAGTDFSKVVKTTVFLSDMNHFVRFNELYATYFPLDPPARSTVQVAALPLGALVEVELIAVP